MVEAKILIVYASRTGNTEKLAQAIAEGARSAGGVGVELKRAKDTKPVDANADAFAFGSHSAFEYMAGELKTVFEDLYPVRDKLAGKPVLIFIVSFQTIFKEGIPSPNLNTSFQDFRMT